LAGEVPGRWRCCHAWFKYGESQKLPAVERQVLDPLPVDGLTQGLRADYRRLKRSTPGALRRLRSTAATYATMFAKHELVLSPVLAHVTPPLGHLSPTVDYPELMSRLTNYVAYTPLNNIAGTPALSLPMGMSQEGVPIGVHFSAAYGDERTLLEVAFALEAEHAFPRI